MDNTVHFKIDKECLQALDFDPGCLARHKIRGTQVFRRLLKRIKKKKRGRKKRLKKRKKRTKDSRKNSPKGPVEGQILRAKLWFLLFFVNLTAFY